MNCRRTNSLLSAYLDGELSGREMGEVRAHLDTCYGCQNEHETLRATQRLVASLSLRVPREELESLLIAQGRQHETARTDSPRFLRAAAWVLGVHPLVLQSSLSWQITASFLRPRPIAAAAFLTLTGFWVGASALDSWGIHEGVVGQNAKWYAAPNAYGSEMLRGDESEANVVPQVSPSGYAAAASLSSFRPAAALAVWLSAPRSEASVNDAAVSLPVVSLSNGPATWNGRSASASPSAFVPAAPSGGTTLLQASFSGR